MLAYKSPPTARSSLTEPVGMAAAATLIFDYNAAIWAVVALLNGTTTVKVPSMFSWKSRIRIVLAWAELVPGSVSDVESRGESRDPQKRPAMITALHTT